jgi:hypothetical protein
MAEAAEIIEFKLKMPTAGNAEIAEGIKNFLIISLLSKINFKRGIRPQKPE